MKTQDTEIRMTEEDLAAMARIAGLHISGERLPRLTNEMHSALQADRDLECAVQKATEAGGAAFDAAWPVATGRRGA